MITLLKCIMWLIFGILAFLALLSFVPVGVRGLYTPEGLDIRVKVCFFSFRIHSSGKKEDDLGDSDEKKKSEQKKEAQKKKGKQKSPKEKQSKKEKSEKKAKGKKKKNKQSGSSELMETIALAQSFLPLIIASLKTLSDKKRIHELNLELVVGDEDPVKATLLYGQAHALLGTLWIPLDQGLNLEKGRGRVVLEFEETVPAIYGKLVVTITIGQIIFIALKLGLGGYKLMSQGKGKKQDKMKSEAN